MQRGIDFVSTAPNIWGLVINYMEMAPVSLPIDLKIAKQLKKPVFSNILRNVCINVTKLRHEVAHLWLLTLLDLGQEVMQGVTYIIVHCSNFLNLLTKISPTQEILYTANNLSLCKHTCEIKKKIYGTNKRLNMVLEQLLQVSSLKIKLFTFLFILILSNCYITKNKNDIK